MRWKKNQKLNTVYDNLFTSSHCSWPANQKAPFIKVADVGKLLSHQNFVGRDLMIFPAAKPILAPFDGSCVCVRVMCYLRHLCSTACFPNNCHKSY